MKINEKKVNMLLELAVMDGRVKVGEVEECREIIKEFLLKEFTLDVERNKITPCIVTGKDIAEMLMGGDPWILL